MDDKITQFAKVISVHEISIKGLDRSLKIKVLQLSEHQFQAISNLRVKKDRIPHVKDSPEQALQSSLKGFLSLFTVKGEVEEFKDW